MVFGFYASDRKPVVYFEKDNDIKFFVKSGLDCWYSMKEFSINDTKEKIWLAFFSKDLELKEITRKYFVSELVF